VKSIIGGHPIYPYLRKNRLGRQYPKVPDSGLSKRSNPAALGEKHLITPRVIWNTEKPGALV
jgi:hypothetical protein